MTDSFIYSPDTLKSILDELSMFEQDQYCITYRKNKNLHNNIDDNKYNDKSKIAAACFRHAKEFYVSSHSVSLASRPLLLSYACNNYIQKSQ